MENLIQVKYYFKEHPNTTLSVFLKTKEQVEAFKAKHPDDVYVEAKLFTLFNFLFAELSSKKK